MALSCIGQGAHLGSIPIALRRGGLTATLTAAALVAASATAAYAGSNEFAIFSTYTGNCAGQSYNSYAFFKEYSDVVEANDRCSIGKSALTQWKVGSAGVVRSLWWQRHPASVWNLSSRHYQKS